jgi:hypothetical protein
LKNCSLLTLSQEGQQHDFAVREVIIKDGESVGKPPGGEVAYRCNGLSNGKVRLLGRDAVVEIPLSFGGAVERLPVPFMHSKQNALQTCHTQSPSIDLSWRKPVKRCQPITGSNLANHG